jgi:anaerobic magnesium-protoporphyrin IX monomethyl ester cyclase
VSTAVRLRIAYPSAPKTGVLHGAGILRGVDLPAPGDHYSLSDPVTQSPPASGCIFLDDRIDRYEVMARVLLLAPSPSENNNNFIPYALLFLRSALEDRGHEVALIDLQLGREAYEAYREELLKGPDVLGVSLFCGPAVPLAIKASRLCRRLSPRTRVVWGGIVPTISPEMVLEEPSVDYVIRYEAEESLVRFVDAVVEGRRPEDTPSIAYRRGGRLVVGPPPVDFADLSGFLPIEFEDADSDRYVFKEFHFGKRVVPIFTSRGCPYSCTFCYNHFYNRQKWRPFPVEWTLDTIDKLVRVFNIDGLLAFDDNFFVDRDRVRRILTGVGERGHDIRWWVELRIDQILQMSVAELNDFHRLGIEVVYVGAESGCDRVLRLLGKRITADNVREANRKLTETRISPCYSFIVGAPTETADETLQTVGLAMELMEANPRAWLWQFNQYTPYPGTPLYETAVKNGFRAYTSLDDWNVGWTFRSENLSSSTLSNAEMASLRYAALFQKPDHCLGNRSFVYKTIFKAFRSIFARRLRRRIFTPFIDTWAIDGIYRASEILNNLYLKTLIRRIDAGNTEIDAS